jgi:hypothetical protein
MMDVIRFFFDNGWHFAGLVVVLCLLAITMVDMADALIKIILAVKRKGE